ncbi:Cys-tRNA(Pro) deacylase [Paenibacillus campi]|uniref:Cys-tRNA(Pro) deacylase n=1 Tax=Paenibacillus campi TaxID=3106031 RepID=UPI002AFEC1C7|nr:Cys-tRNA(Pro) deacylase [Paenibacillus sp. SGZ-1009]
MSITKTNALRILDKEHIHYNVYEYDPEDGQVHGTAVAEKIGKPAPIVHKTLVTRGKNGLHIFVIPVAEELDLKKAARAANEKKLDMLPVKELLAHTGYIRGGCSPVGMKKLYPTFIDQRAEMLEQMIVSAGKIGMQMELALDELAEVTKARFAEVCV